MKATDISFEQALKKMDEVLSKLNDGDIALEEALSEYKVGMDMAMICQHKLQVVEGQIKMLQNKMEVDFSLGAEGEK